MRLMLVRSVAVWALAPVVGAGMSAMTAEADVIAVEPKAAIEALAAEQVGRRHLQSLLLQVRIDGVEALTVVHGTAMTGVPVTRDHHFRNGAVALAYVAAMALRLAEDGVVDLDVPISRWLPELPAGDKATLRMLANMTAGYPDHVADEEQFIAPFYADPFAHWSPEALIDISLSAERRFEPGENWDYSHSGYVILGRTLEAATGRPMAELMADHVLAPLGLSETHGFDTAMVPDPVLHAFTAERGVWEDSTHWNPSWTLPSGAIQVTTITDMARSFDAIVGHDGFLTAESRAQMIEPRLVGFGAPLDGCPTCRTLSETFSYGLGTALQGDWVFQTPSFGGYAASVGTLPEGRADGGRITIAAVATFTPDSHADWTGGLPNWADETVRLAAAILVPGNPPPMPPSREE